MKKINLLTKYNIRKSGPREEIIKAVSSLRKRHFSADEIIHHLKQEKKHISRASVYRTINIFSEKGLLRQIDTGMGFKTYEPAYDSPHHDHMYCMKCRKIVEFEEGTIENLQKAVCKKNRFYPMGHTLRIIGLCNTCRARYAKKK